MPKISTKFLIIVVLYFVAVRLLFKKFVSLGVPEIILSYMTLSKQYMWEVEIGLALVMGILAAVIFLLIYILYLRGRGGGGLK